MFIMLERDHSSPPWSCTSSSGASSSSSSSGSSSPPSSDGPCPYSPSVSKNLVNPSNVLSPVYSTILLSPFLNNLIVGNDCTFVCSSSLTVASILPMTTVSLSLYFSPN